MRCYIGLGSNLGERERYIIDAIKKISSLPGVVVKRISNIYETEPVGDINQPKYMNAAAELETSLSARELLDEMQKIEKELGRVRTVRWGARTIDIDILKYGNQEINELDLRIPHPEIDKRDFVKKTLRDLDA